MGRQKVREEEASLAEADYRASIPRGKQRRQRDLPDWEEEHVGSSYTTTPRAQRNSMPEAPEVPDVPRSRSRASRLSSTPRKAAPSRPPPMDDSDSNASSSTMPPSKYQDTRQQLVRAPIRSRPPSGGRSRPPSDVSSDHTEEAVRSRKVGSRSRHASPKSVKSAKSTRSRKSVRHSRLAHPQLGSPTYSESGSDISTPDGLDDDQSDAFQVEILDADDELSRRDRSRMPSRDTYMDSRDSSVEDRRRFRRRRPRRSVPNESEDESSPFRRHSISDFERSAPVSNNRSASRSVYTRSPSRSNYHRSKSRSIGRSASRSAPQSRAQSRAPSVYAPRIPQEVPQVPRALRSTDILVESRPPIVAAQRSNTIR